MKFNKNLMKLKVSDLSFNKCMKKNMRLYINNKHYRKIFILSIYKINLMNINKMNIKCNYFKYN